MASITDSIRAVNSDNYAILKLGAFAYFFYLLFEMTTAPATETTANATDGAIKINYIQIGLLAFFYSGFCSIIMNNRITQSVVTLPPFDPLKILSVCAKCAVVALPYLVVGIPIIIYAQGFFHFEGVVQLIAISIIELIIFKSFVGYMIIQVATTWIQNVCLAIYAGKKYPFLNGKECKNICSRTPRTGGFCYME